VCVCVHSPRSGVWEPVKGLPSEVQAKKVHSAEEKDSVMSLLSSSEIDHQQSAFLYNKVLSCFTASSTNCGLSLRFSRNFSM